MNDHLIFFDGECGFCDKSITFVRKHDTEKLFLFAPLQGETAKKWISQEYRENLRTSILVENYKSAHPKISFYGKGAFRTLWLLGGWWKLLGWPCFLPSVFYDWGYRLIARHRGKLVTSCPVKPRDNDRFLP